jgi:hypothetical protein
MTSKLQILQYCVTYGLLQQLRNRNCLYGIRKSNPILNDLLEHLGIEYKVSIIGT